MMVGSRGLAATAQRLTAEQGATVTLSAATGSYSPATGAVEGGKSETQKAGAIVETFAAAAIDGSLVRRGDKRLLVSPKTVDGRALALPEVDGTATIAGVPHAIKAVEVVAPAGVPLLYVLQVRS